MPLVKLDKHYQAELLDREVRKRKAEFRITNKTMEDLSIIFDRFGFSIDTIAKVFRRGAKK